MSELYAVTYRESYYIPGDERSRTNPGHGYPDRTEYREVLTQFKSLDELENWIRVYGHTQTYAVFKLVPMKVKETLSFEIT